MGICGEDTRSQTHVAGSERAKPLPWLLRVGAEDVMLTYLNMLMDEGYTVEQVEKTRDDDGHVKYL